MLKYLAMVSTNQLNYFPVKGGISKHYSPHLLMKKRDLKYRDCEHPFGTYVQANQENQPTNDNQPRTIDGIYLRKINDKHHGHEVMNLETGAVITCARVWEIPIAPLIIKAVESLGEKQGVKTLKIVGKNKQPILPVDWVAGVDYD